MLQCYAVHKARTILSSNGILRLNLRPKLTSPHIDFIHIKHWRKKKLTLARGMNRDLQYEVCTSSKYLFCKNIWVVRPPAQY